MVTVLDQRKAGFAAAAIDEEAANIAIALSARKGYLDGRSLAEVFAWLRPTDLVWRYWVNNYVRGQVARGLRRAVLERRHHTDGRGAAPRHGDDGSAQFACHARCRQHAGHAGGPQPVDHRRLRGGGDRRPHIAVASLLSQRPAARHQETRALCCRPAGTSPPW